MRIKIVFAYTWGHIVCSVWVYINICSFAFWHMLLKLQKVLEVFKMYALCQAEFIYCLMKVCVN